MMNARGSVDSGCNLQESSYPELTSGNHLWLQSHFRECANEGGFKLCVKALNSCWHE